MFYQHKTPVPCWFKHVVVLLKRCVTTFGTCVWMLACNKGKQLVLVMLTLATFGKLIFSCVCRLILIMPHMSIGLGSVLNADSLNICFSQINFETNIN